MNRGSIMTAIKEAIGDALLRVAVAFIFASIVVTGVNQARQVWVWLTPSTAYFEVKRLEVTDMDMSTVKDVDAVRVYFQRHVKVDHPLAISYRTEVNPVDDFSREYCHSSGSAVYHTDKNDTVLRFTRNQWFSPTCNPPPGCYENRNTWTFMVDGVPEQVSKTSNPFSVYRGDFVDYCKPNSEKD